MDEALLIIFGNHIRANSDVNGDLTAINDIRDYYNGMPVVDFWIWLPRMSVSDIGDSIDARSFGDISAGNSDQLTCYFTVAQESGVQPARIDCRAFLADMFSTAGGQPAVDTLNASFSRTATEAEKAMAETGVDTGLFHSGDGTNQGDIENESNGAGGTGPARGRWTGSVNNQMISTALNLTA